MKRTFSTQSGTPKPSDGIQIHALVTLASFYTSHDTSSLTIKLRYNIQGEGGSGNGDLCFGAMIIDMDEMEKIPDYYNKFSTQPGVLKLMNNSYPFDFNDKNQSVYNMVRDGMISTPLHNKLHTPGHAVSGLPDLDKANNGWDNLPWMNRNDTRAFEFDGILSGMGVRNKHFSIVAYIGVSTNASIKIYNTPGDSWVQFNH
jgi:hypothetical protein